MWERNSRIREGTAGETILGVTQFEVGAHEMRPKRRADFICPYKTKIRVTGKRDFSPEKGKKMAISDWLRLMLLLKRMPTG